MEEGVRYTIRDNVPIPSPRTRWSFPFDDLKVGQVAEFTAEEDDARKGVQSARGALWRRKEKDSTDAKEFSVARTDDGFGIWRTK